MDEGEGDRPASECLPPDCVIVVWFPETEEKLVHISLLICMERAIAIGDIVKRAASVTGDTGVVVNIRSMVAAMPINLVRHGVLIGLAQQMRSLRGIVSSNVLSAMVAPMAGAPRMLSSANFKNVRDYYEGALVVCRSWIGIVRQVQEKVVFHTHPIFGTPC